MLDYKHDLENLKQAQLEIANKLMMAQYNCVKQILLNTKLEPLSEEQILDIIGELSKMDGEFTFESFWLKYARLIEKAHGIEQVSE